MIVDACLFAGESAMLELRLRTLADHVERFVVVACARTYQGDPVDRQRVQGAFHAAARDLPVQASLHWHEPSRVLIKHGRPYERPATERGPAGSPWFAHIERQHREHVLVACREAGISSQAILMISDVDEIPNPEAVQMLPTLMGPMPLTLETRFHSTALNLLHPQQPWYGTTISSFADAEPQRHRDERTAIGTRRQRILPVARGGWHLSWMGTDAERQHKLDTFSHAELVGRFDPAEGRRTLRHANGERLQHTTRSESQAFDWPAPLLDRTFLIPPSWITADAWQT